MGPREFQLLMIFWQLGLVDTFNVIKLCVNGGSQYLGVVLSSAAGNTTQLGVKTVLEPILGLGTSYQFIKAAEGPRYINVRKRITLCLLAISGIRINELLSLKVEQLQTLVEESWIAIDRSKRGPSNHKAFLTKEGKKIIKDRQKDFQLIFLMKKPESFLFTSEAHHSKPVRREVITKDLNKLMRQVSKQLNDKPNITSHSFRIGYITQLWKDTKDIEFVNPNIGHRMLDTTSAYINQLSYQERQKRIDQLEQVFK